MREWGPPEAMRLAEVPRPKAGQGRALVRVEAAALGVYWGEYKRQPETMRAVLADLLATLDRGRDPARDPPPQA